MAVCVPPKTPDVRARHRGDLLSALIAGVLVVLAAIVGYWCNTHGQPVHADTAPLFGRWRPRVGPGTVPAVAVAAVVVWFGPARASRWPWRRLLGVGYLAAVAWTLSLALVDGWDRGIARRLNMPGEYLRDARSVTDLGAVLPDFTRRILDFQPDSWQTQIAGHPPGALVIFALLQRLGLGGGGIGLLCILIGASVAVTIPLTLRLLGAPAATARVTVPFLVLFPGAVWVGVSGDGLFAGVLAAGVVLLATGCVRRGLPADLASAAGGLLLGYALFLSYGFVLFAPLALVPALVSRRLRPVLVAGTAVLAVVVAFILAGFWWLDGYHALVTRYYQGIAAQRAYAYWVWADVACLVLCAGPAAAPMLRRVAAGLARAGAGAVPRWRDPVLLLPLSAAVAMLVATLSGMSKAEVERIWLPFAVWLPAAAALLPPGTRRGWLLGQAVTALLVNHLLVTV